MAAMMDIDDLGPAGNGHDNVNGSEQNGFMDSNSLDQLNELDIADGTSEEKSSVSEISENILPPVPRKVWAPHWMLLR